MSSVITYRHAYTGGESALCAAHADAPGRASLLGAVTLGEHAGRCDDCSRAARAASRAAKARAAELEAQGIDPESGAPWPDSATDSQGRPLVTDAVRAARRAAQAVRS